MRSRIAVNVFLGILLISIPSSMYAQLGLLTAKPVPTGNVHEFDLKLASTDNICTKKPIKEGFTPTDGDPALALCFWDQTQQEYLKYARFVGTSKSMSATTEVVADAIGGVRVALSTAVATNTTNDQGSTNKDQPTADQDKALNLLSANGGNLAFTASYPIYYQTLGKSTGAFLWNSYARFAANIAALGSQTETTVAVHDVNANLELALADLHVDLLGTNKNINILLYAKGSAIRGTRKFADSLATGAKTTFASAQFGGGLRVNQLLLLYVGYNWYSDRTILGRGGTLSVVFSK